MRVCVRPPVPFPSAPRVGPLLRCVETELGLRLSVCRGDDGDDDDDDAPVTDHTGFGPEAIVGI